MEQKRLCKHQDGFYMSSTPLRKRVHTPTMDPQLKGLSSTYVQGVSNVSKVLCPNSKSVNPFTKVVANMSQVPILINKCALVEYVKLPHQEVQPLIDNPKVTIHPLSSLNVSKP